MFLHEAKYKLNQIGNNITSTFSHEMFECTICPNIENIVATDNNLFLIKIYSRRFKQTKRFLANDNKCIFSAAASEECKFEGIS